MIENFTTVMGIDLGTTYSCAAYINENGNPVIAKNCEGANTTPSVVHFDLDDPKLWDAGQVAKDNAIIDPKRTSSFVKRIMGTSPVAIVVDGVTYKPEEISSFILQKVTNDARDTMPMRFTSCVITVPAYFGFPENKATLAAAEIAGLDVIGLVQEPVAAAINYGCDRSGKDEVVLVYDLGGGTFDAAVVSIRHDQDKNINIDVVCNAGDKLLGGGDWDGEIIRYLKDEFIQQTGFEDEFDEYAEQSLQIEAEKLKIQLSQRTKASVVLNFTGKPAKIELDRQTYDEITEHLLSKTIDIMHQCLDNARSKGFDPERVLLVGGSTKMPQVKERLEKELPGMPIEINDPDEAVAKGAARYAMQMELYRISQLKTEKSDDNPDPAPGPQDETSIISTIGGHGRKISIRTVTVKSYAVETKDRKTGKVFLTNIITKNQLIDSEDGQYKRTKRFGTYEDDMSDVAIKVYENDSEEEQLDLEGEPLAEATIDIDGLHLPALSPIDVTFSLDSQGILDVYAVEPGSGHSCRLRLEVVGAMTQEEIRQAREKSNSMTMLR